MVISSFLSPHIHFISESVSTSYKIHLNPLFSYLHCSLVFHTNMIFSPCHHINLLTCLHASSQAMHHPEADMTFQTYYVKNIKLIPHFGLQSPPRTCPSPTLPLNALLMELDLSFWASFHSLNRPSCLLPQGLCIDCSLLLDLNMLPPSH